MLRSFVYAKVYIYNSLYIVEVFSLILINILYFEERTSHPSLILF